MSGDGAARRRRFEELVHPHFGTLHAFAWHLTRNPARADLLTRQAVVLAYRRFEGPAPPADAGTWLLGLAARAFAGGDPRSLDGEPATAAGPAPGSDYEGALERSRAGSLDNPEDALSCHLGASDVEGALARLPPEQRLPVVLCLVLGLTYGEAAEVLATPASDVAARLHSGRRALQAGLLDLAASRGLAGRHEGAETGEPQGPGAPP